MFLVDTTGSGHRFLESVSGSSGPVAKAGSLPQRKLTHTAGPDGQNHFLWADAADCKCLYVGTEAAYDRYERLSINQQIAIDNEMAAMNWGAWGAWGPLW